MFVFGFVGDSLAATTTDPLLWAIQTLEMLTTGKQKGTVRWGSGGRESGHYTHILDISLVMSSPSDISCVGYCPSVIDSELWLPSGSLPATGLETMKTDSFRLQSVRDSQLHVGLLQEDNKGCLIHLLSGWASPCHTLTQPQDCGSGMQLYPSIHSLTDRPSQKPCWRFLPFFPYHSKQVCTVVGWRVSCWFSSEVWVIPNGQCLMQTAICFEPIQI